MAGRLGRYELHDVLGIGGFATVYRATDPSLEAVVAVKVLADNWSRDPEVRRRFRAEAVLLRRVQASGSIPGLVEVHDIDEDDTGQPYYVMGFADRGSLAARAGTRSWSPSDVVPVIDALAETVGALHDNDIVHRDLKPTNILLRGDGRADTSGPGTLIARRERLLVGDLGLAKDLRRQATSLSLAGGTHHYLAPEQLDPRATVDHRADVHAATAVLSVLLTGWERPPPGPGTTVGPALHRALEHGLSVEPEQRFSSMSHWRQGLLEAIDLDAGARSPARQRSAPRPQPPGPAQVSSRPGSGPSPTPVGRRRWAAIGVAGLVAAVVLVWLAVRLPNHGGIVGPGEVVVGDAVRYRAPSVQDQSITWIGPNGERVSDQDLEVRPVVPGRLRIELHTDGGRLTRSIQALPSPLGPRVQGPTQARIGESITLRSSFPEGDRSHYWLDPAGVRVADDRLELTPTAPGTLSVALVARGGDGIERGVRHQVEVIP